MVITRAARAAPARPPGATPAPAQPAPGPPADAARCAPPGGPPSAEALALLANPSVTLGAGGIADLRAGRTDPRIVAVPSSVAAARAITVSAMCSDHAGFTAGGSVSRHWFGRRADIAVIEGEAVGPAGLVAREVARALASLHPAIRPDELGSPFAIDLPGYLTDPSAQRIVQAAIAEPVGPRSDRARSDRLAAGFRHVPPPTTPVAAKGMHVHVPAVSSVSPTEPAGTARIQPTPRWRSPRAYAAPGLTFWLMRKTLSGSYFALTWASRA